MIQGFVHPALAVGALLAAVPLIIHLLNRQRHRPLPWAAMRFVLAAYKKTRRRAQLENLLLLLLRMAAVALLAFALSRPFVGGDSPLAALTETRRDMVLVLDGSASTEYREGVRSVHDRILERAREILGELEGESDHRVRLLWAGSRPRLLSWRRPDEALAMLPTLDEPTDERLDLAAALENLREMAEEDAAGLDQSALEVVLLTDLQRSSFELDPTHARRGPEAESALRQLERLDELGVQIVVEDLGPPLPEPPNLAVSDLRPLEPVLGPDTPVEIGVQISNHGTAERNGVRVALSIDGERRPSQVVDVPERGTALAIFPVVFGESGHHVLQAELEGDRLPVDDQRASVVEVPPTLRVLLVDGEPAPEVDEDEVGLLSAVLGPVDDAPGALDRFAPFRSRVVYPDALGTGEVDLNAWDVIWLANCPAPGPRAVEALEARVASGAALVVSLGSNTLPQDYGERLYRPDGSGLLPAQLYQAVHVRDRGEYFRAATIDTEHPALAFFADERWQPLFTELPIYGFLPSEPQAEAGVLARLDDESSSPLLIEKAYDRGRVLLWTTTIDREWSRLSESPRTLVPFVHELLRYAGRAPSPPRNASLGDSIALEVSVFPRGATLERPDGSRRPLDGEPIEVADGVWRLPPVEDAEQIGVYHVELAGAPRESFVLQLDADEGDLARLAPAELDRYPALRLAERGEARSSELDDRDDGRGELWRTFAWACLIALMCESAWAAWLGHKRRIA